MIRSITEHVYKHKLNNVLLAHTSMVCVLFSNKCVPSGTFVAEVVDQDDFCYELWRRAVEHAVNGPQQRRPAFVVERDDDAGVGQLLCIQLLFTAAHKQNEYTDIALYTCLVTILQLIFSPFTILR